MTQPLARVIEDVMRATAPFAEFFTTSRYIQKAGSAEISDFVAGNPQEMALPAFVDAIRAAAIPQDKNWFAYKGSERVATDVVAATMRERTGLAFTPSDIQMTKGCSTALAIVMRTIAEAGDEVIYLSPPWFFYESMIVASGATPVKVRVDKATFDIDVDAIAAAITPRTRAVLVNTPHNPTGKIYPAATLARLAAVLKEAQESNGRALYLVSDEAYNRILFDGRSFSSPAEHYANTLVCYTYGKTLLTPGMRLGYIAVPPAMDDADAVKLGLTLTGLTGAYGVPDSILQYAIPELEKLSIDIPHLQRKRDRLVSELTRLGYEVNNPEATFYLMVKSPIPDEAAFIELLAEHDVFVLPGITVDMPGQFRLSATASDDMIERSIPGFAAAMEEALARA